ncbi:MAG: type II toxin-antitoxin system VapC family toxin [Actinomycetia bacterium]|nr:type II toxin-antitoxin system VapC family toxin [Actinomycetes bacterium]
MSVRPVVVDSSIAVKWLKPQGEEHVAEAFALLEAHEDGRIELAAPTHLLLEVMNALWSHHASAEDIQKALDLLMGLRMTLVVPDAELLKRSAALAVEHRLSIYDAVFAALAERLDCELVTDGRQLAESGARRVRALG